MDNKILIITGPTAVGKTDLAIQLAKKYNGEIISADSRQVYKGMDIGTGKDLPPKGVNIWGYDVVYPNEEWSPAQFVQMANIWIKGILRRKKLPIIVGGDGFYLKALINPPQTLYMQPDRDLRREIEKGSVEQLQNRLKKLNRKRFNKMNNSDRNNPHRLVRAIEVALSQPDCHGPAAAGPRNDATLIGLTAPIRLIDTKIELRVQARLKTGVENEVRKLVNKYGWNRTLLSTIAYKEWKDYFEGKGTRKEAINNWTTHEKQYARKQMTWFKKQNDIRWFDIEKKDFRYDIMELICEEQNGD